MKITIGDRLKQLSLRRQQLLFFAVVTVFVVIIIGTSVGATARYADVFGTNLNRYFHIQELRSALSLAHDRVEIYFRHGEDFTRQQIEEAAQSVEASYERLSEMQFADVPSRHELRATYYGLIAYRATIQEALGLLEADNDWAFVSLARADRIRGYVDLYLEQLFQIQLDHGRRGYEEALRQLNTIRVLGFSGIFLVSIALAIFALLFSRSVTRPLDRLAKEAHALAAGDFDRAPMEVPVSEDLQDVALAFNRMTTGIRELVANLKDQQKLQQQLHQQELSNLGMERLLREAQLVALQSQVNPHFLFNTLNSVARTARVEGAEASEKLIRGLSSVLRYILRNPRRSVALHEEMRIAEEYLSLQAVRFGDRLRYQVHVAPQARNAQIPPLILQPLVENAVLYGIEPIEEGGAIDITAITVAEDRTLVISIVDDGAGMSTATVERISAEEMETAGDSTSGIGILNVRARLKLFFGPEQRFDITSAPGEGTRIEITVPYNEEAETYGLQRSDS